MAASRLRAVVEAWEEHQEAKPPSHQDWFPWCIVRMGKLDCEFTTPDVTDEEGAAKTSPHATHCLRNWAQEDRPSLPTHRQDSQWKTGNEWKRTSMLASTPQSSWRSNQQSLSCQDSNKRKAHPRWDPVRHEKNSYQRRIKAAIVCVH